MEVRGNLPVVRNPAGRGTKIATIFAAVVTVVLACVLWWLFEQFNTTVITAYFDRSVGIYPGSDVRVLGVPVGSVDTTDPTGNRVKVVMKVDRRFDIPADAKAAQITSSLVADRYIQLTPVYKGGAKMARNATIPKERTATPVEVDRLYRSIQQLSDAFGPSGANADGAFNDLLRTSAANLAGNGNALADSLTQLSHAASTVSGSRGDLFDTIENLRIFTHTLAENDTQVRAFNTQLADLAGFLAGERHDLGQALALLSTALGDVARFIDENRDLVARNADALTTLTRTLADQRDDLTRLLPVLPLALSNLVNAGGHDTGTLDIRPNFPELQDPFGVVCKLLDLRKLRPGDPAFDAIGTQLQPILDHCATITGQITAGVKTPTLILPFGILSADNQQRAPIPGTPSDQLPPSQQPGRQR